MISRLLGSSDAADPAAAKLHEEPSTPEEFDRFVCLTRELNKHIAKQQLANDLDDQIQGLELKESAIKSRMSQREQADLERVAKISRNNVERKRDFYHHCNPNRKDKIQKLEMEAVASRDATAADETELAGTQASYHEVRSKRDTMPTKLVLEERASALHAKRTEAYGEVVRSVRASQGKDAAIFVLEAELKATEATLALDEAVVAAVDGAQREAGVSMASTAGLMIRDNPSTQPSTVLGAEERERARGALLLLAAARADLSLQVLAEHFPATHFAHAPLRRLVAPAGEADEGERPSVEELKDCHRDLAKSQLADHFAPPAAPAAAAVNAILNNEAAVAEANIAAMLALRQARILAGEAKLRADISRETAALVAAVVRVQTWQLVREAVALVIEPLEPASAVLSLSGDDPIALRYDRAQHDDAVRRRTAERTVTGWAADEERAEDQLAELSALAESKQKWLADVVGLTPKVVAGLAPTVAVAAPATPEPSPRRKSFRDSVRKLFTPNKGTAKQPVAKAAAAQNAMGAVPVKTPTAVDNAAASA